jgi:hypothetical protein
MHEATPFPALIAAGPAGHAAPQFIGNPPHDGFSKTHCMSETQPGVPTHVATAV